MRECWARIKGWYLYTLAGVMIDFTIILALVVGGLIFASWLAGCEESPEAKARREWEQQHCKLFRTDRTPGNMAPVFGPHGVQWVFIPSTTTHVYKCDDGTEFSR